VMDPHFVARVRDGLKTGGLLLMDRPYRSLDHPEANWPDTEADKANAWLKAWSDLQIVFYEDTTGMGDWQQTAVPARSTASFGLFTCWLASASPSGAAHRAAPSAEITGGTSPAWARSRTRVTGARRGTPSGIRDGAGG